MSAVLLAFAVAYALYLPVGSFSAFGWENLSLLCPLGALTALLSGKLLIPRVLCLGLSGSPNKPAASRKAQQREKPGRSGGGEGGVSGMPRRGVSGKTGGKARAFRHRLAPRHSCGMSCRCGRVRCSGVLSRVSCGSCFRVDLLHRAPIRLRRGHLGHRPHSGRARCRASRFPQMVPLDMPSGGVHGSCVQGQQDLRAHGR